MNTEQTVIKEANTVGGLLKVVIPIALGMFLVGFDANLFFFGGTFILKTIKVNQFLLGIAGSGFAAGIAIFSVIGGYIFDKITTRNGIIISLTIISLFSALTGFVSNQYELVIYRFLVGFGTGMIQPEIIAFLGDIRPERRQTIIASEGIAFGLGLFVAPYIYAAYSTATTFDIPFIIAGISGAALIGVVIALVPSKYKLYQRPKKGILEVLNPSLIVISLSFFFFGVAFFAFQSYFTAYLTAYGFSEGNASFVFSFFGLALLIATLPAGVLGDAFNRKMVILAASVVMALASIVLFIHSPVFAVAALGTILFGAGYGMYGNVNAFAQDSVEDAWRGSAVGFMFLIFNLGTIIGSPLMGIAVNAVGYHLAGIYVILVPLFVSLVLVGITPNVKHAVASQEAEVLGEGE
ncbi:MAG: transporter [Thermoplasmatales archaeon A-plasma]|nr:MAG: transporter [Thermoplasmatales archaeon A-plasma]WMT45182.1 MAG: MFS transporter [Cuniculiplasma divulgatum]